VGNFFCNTVLFHSAINTASFILFFLTAIYIFSGCTIKGATYTESNNGDNLNLKINDVIKIRLESNVTTGFKWNLSEESNSGIIALVSSDYTEKENKDNLVGVGGFETFTFKAVSSGSTIIILTYNKPWERGVQPEKIFKLNISVQ